MKKERWVVFCDDDYGIFDECTGKVFNTKDEAQSYCDKMNQQHAPAFFYCERI